MENRIIRNLSLITFTFSLASAVARADGALAPAAFEPLPAGSITPEGWLGRNLRMQADGLVGHLYETSPLLAPSNSWITHEHPKAACWEEGPYWARTFVKLAVLTRDPRLLAESERWMKAQLDQSLPDGWYGPRDRHVRDGKGPEIFPHIVMDEAILTWYEYTKDKRYLELLRKFFDFLDDLPEESFLSYNYAEAPKDSSPQDWEKTLAAGTGAATPSYHYWQRVRGGDMLPALFRVYGLTGDEKCLSLADKVFRKTMSPGRFWKHETGYAAMWGNIHTVNFAERFPYGTVYARRSGNGAHRMMGDYWYDLHMQMWGQMPRGAHASGEQIRAGKTDPNQSFESCTVSELTRSYCLMGGATGERKWGDRAEDMVFNYTPGTCTPDWKKIHYLNAPNMVNLDVRTNHDYYNGGGCVAYSANAYRCCLHNGSLSLPLFAENLVQRGKDGEMVVFLYAPHAGKADFGNGTVAWEMKTRYPFRETVELTVDAPRPLTLRLRVPAWCRAFSMDGKALASEDGWAVCTVPKGSSRHVIAMRAECAYTFYPRNGGVSVDRGPLTYSLALGEAVNVTNKLDHWTKKLGTDLKTEYLVSTPWNYALDVKKPLAYRELAYHDECFASTNAACEITAWGKRAPEWQLHCNQPGDIPFMPVAGEGDEVPLRFVPMACQRCRVTVFPQLAGEKRD